MSGTSENVEINLEEDDSIEVEIIDDTPEADKNKRLAPESTDNDEDISPKGDEISRYKDDIQQRIKNLSEKAHAERRTKENAIKERDYAVKYAEKMMEENNALKNYSNYNENAFVLSSKQKAEIQRISLKKQAKDAYEAGETEKLLDLQEELGNVNHNLATYSSYQPKRTDNEVQRFSQQNVQNQEVEQKITPDPEALIWYNDNEWFEGDSLEEAEMTAYAFNLSDILIKKRGVDPKSKEYYNEISKSVRKIFPDYAAFKGKNVSGEISPGTQNPNNRSQTVREPMSRPNTVVAPAIRSMSGNRKVVQLSQSQIRLSKRLGLTTQQYAAQILREHQSQEN